MDGRLEAIAEMAGSGGGVADIGSDHALLVCALVERGRASFGLACEVAEGPLARSRAQIARRGLQGKVTPILSDGLEKVPRAGLDRIVAAGMGGELIARILEDCPYRADPGLTWLLQPMTRPEHLRRRLWEMGFALEEERCCAAAGRIYSVMRARIAPGALPEPDARALWFGATDPGADPLAGRYREAVASRLRGELSGLREAESADRGRIVALELLIEALGAGEPPAGRKALRKYGDGGNE